MPTPIATYRLQLHAGFGFDDVAAVAPYLAELGVSHVYLSPILQAAPGSAHGYDVIDHSTLNEELGGEAGYERMVKALDAAGLDHMVDIVPNHMSVAAGRKNRWWWDVLENGPSSRWASFFDVDWTRPDPKVLLPVLGDHYGRVLEWRELTLVREGGSFVVRYFDHEAPISPRTLDELLGAAAVTCESDELASIAVAFGRLPPATSIDRASVDERHRDKEVLRGRLTWLCDNEPGVAEAIDAEVAAHNADPDRLDALLLRQNFRFAYWATAGQSIDYRRFFDINELVGLNMDDPQVFEESHDLLLRLLTDVRVDHPDGLRDPQRYCERLRARAGEGAYIVVEKILETGLGETLPASWPVQGTTGYDWLNVACGLFVDQSAEADMTERYQSFTGEAAPFAEVAYESKQHIMRESLAADLDRLTSVAMAVCEGRRSYRDYTRRELREALREIAAAFPVYRTYARPGREASEADVWAVETALAAASGRRTDLDPMLLAFLRDLLLGRAEGEAEAELCLRFQQFTSPVMAKGVEDTAFYRYFRLAALNEVGGDPGRFGVSVAEFHDHNQRMAGSWPATMLATSTHDTKRSEDVRLRMALLTEMPDQWSTAVRRWAARNRRHGGVDANTEYLLYQTLVGAWPLSVERAWQYMEKAIKEAKVRTSWVAPDAEYEAAVRAFVEGALADDDFVADLSAFVEPLAERGREASLGLTLLKLTSPGVPDLYQGTEDWDLSLVDPDNRRPIDWERLRRWEAPKQRLVRRALAARRRRWSTAYAPGCSYEPLEVSGVAGGAVVAFVRGGEAITVVSVRRPAGDEEVTLPPGQWRDELGDESGHASGRGGQRWSGRVRLSDLTGEWPVALLGRETG